MSEAPTRTSKIILDAFREGVAALRVFTERIGKHADEHDDRAMTEFATRLAALLGLPSESEGADHVRGNGGEQTAPPDLPAGLDDAEIKRRTEEILADPERRRQFSEALASLRKASPQQGEILRRGAIITVMSHLEALIADLIHAYYSRYPAALPADERSLTLAELRGLASVAEAEQHLVTQEVDAVLRETLERQLAYFTKRPKVDMSALGPLRARLLEIDQRRNLYVHNRGVVNKRYLRGVDEALANEYSVKEGDNIRTSDDYLQAALDTALAAGVILSQLCWRKWEKGEVNEADGAVIEVMFEALIEERYALVKAIAEFAGHLDLASDENRRIITVNHAIALRDSGDVEKVEQVLATCDWSACSLRFRLALAALRNDHVQAWRLIPRAIAAEEIEQDEIHRWPLFRPLRQAADFGDRIAEVDPTGETREEVHGNDKSSSDDSTDE